MPGFIAGKRERELPDGLETKEPPVKKSLGKQMCPGNPPTKSFSGSCMLPCRQEECQSIPVPRVLKRAFKQDRRMAVSEDLRNQKLPSTSVHHARDVSKRKGLGQVVNMELKDQTSRTVQPRLPLRAALVSDRACTESQEPSSNCVVGHSLRMIFTRIKGDCWTCRFVEGAQGLPIVEQIPPSESSASQEKGEGARSQVPRSVLYEDLLVSSSSEDSDGE